MSIVKWSSAQEAGGVNVVVNATTLLEVAVASARSSSAPEVAVVSGAVKSRLVAAAAAASFVASRNAMV